MLDMFKKISFILFVILSGQLMASECVSNVDADFANDGMSVTAISDKGLSNVVLQFADGSEQKFEIGKDGQYSLDFSGTGSNEGKTITGVWIKSGCEQSGDGPGYGEYIDACPLGLEVGFGPDQVLTEPLITEQVMSFQLGINQAISTRSCIVAANYSTKDGAIGFNTATAGSDYVQSAGEVIFTFGLPLNISFPIVILATGQSEPTEAFTISLTNTTNATVTDSEAVGIIETIEF